MHRTIGALCLLTFVTAGCGADSSSPSTSGTVVAVGSHGGFAVALPGEKGTVEVLVEGSKPPKPGTSKLIVYFLSPDGKAALTTLPTEVTAKVIPPVGEPETVPLKPEPKTGDPTSSARFASTRGKYDYDELKGEITATLDGQPVTVPFALR